MPVYPRVLLVALSLVPCSLAQESHDHPAPEKLGKVTFSTSCQPSVQDKFERGVALLHSFAYGPARKAFQEVASQDPQCAMAHWGIAMSYYHQLWEPPTAADVQLSGRQEITLAQSEGTASLRDRQWISALALIFQDSPGVPYGTRVVQYAHAMGAMARDNKDDVETQVFYALALLASASPADKAHANQKEAVEIIEPLYRRFPNHPGLAHYMIHTCDNAELATRGLPAARAYAGIAPSVPHALHMPSHIFTRLGLWSDSINSNRAARASAHEQGDVGEELHAMDYLVYATLQLGRDEEAAEVISKLTAMRELNLKDAKVAYAATAMPIRYAVERGQWAEAERMTEPAGAPPQVAALAVWARGMGLARTGHAVETPKLVTRLQELTSQLQTAGNSYWSTQTEILAREVQAWTAQAENKPEEAVALMQAAADEEDGIEKLPVTPGPIIPARELLGSLLLAQNRAGAALEAFRAVLKDSPGRRGALEGEKKASEADSEAPR